MDDVRQAAGKYAREAPFECSYSSHLCVAFIAGAEWQAKRHAEQPALAVTAFDRLNLSSALRRMAEYDVTPESPKAEILLQAAAALLAKGGDA